MTLRLIPTYRLPPRYAPPLALTITGRVPTWNTNAAFATNLLIAGMS